VLPQARSADLSSFVLTAIKGVPLKALLKVSGFIDALNERVGSIVIWAVLASVLISAGNAISRKAFDLSSNAWLEIQWYLFAAVFMLAAGYTYLKNEHVRIDVVSGRLSARGRTWIDILGIIFFLMPWIILMLYLGVPYFHQAFVSGEMSSNAGGLIRWPAYLLIPVGVALLGLQAISELIKRIGFLAGHCEDPAAPKAAKSAEEELADFVRQQSEAAAVTGAVK
jgi:TRAP-type mannitol/chloroaromatic compound transport system permease small subunit